MAVEELTLSTFLRNPKDVIARLDHGDVVLRRRGARSLRLSLQGRSQDRDSGTGLVARLLTNAAHDGAARAALLNALRQSISWLDFLPAHAQEEFLAEFLRMVEACAEIGTYAPLSQLMREWQEAAAIYADPELARELSRPLPGQAGTVPEPMASAVS